MDNSHDAAFFTDDTTHIYILEDYVYHDVLINRIGRSCSDSLREEISKVMDETIPMFD